MARERSTSTLVGAAALIAGVTLLARIAGFARWLVFSDTVGANCVGEAYASANQLPNVLFEVVAGGALAGAVVPLLAGPLAAASGQAEADRIASALLGWALAVLIPVALVLALLAGPLASLVLDGQSCPGQHALAVRMLIVFAPQVVLYGVGVVLTGVLQAHRRFGWPALAPLLSSLVVMAAYEAYARSAGPQRGPAEGLSRGAEAWLAWGTTAGVAVLTVPLLLPVLRPGAAGVRLRPTLRFPPGVPRRAARLAAAGVAALLAQQLCVLVLFRLANGHGDVGAVNVYQYVQAVYLLPYAVLAVPLATSAFPRLAQRAATGDTAGFATAAGRTTRAVLVVAFLGAGVLTAAAPAVAALFVAIDVGRVAGMAGAATAMAPGLVGFALIAHVGRALYALERGRLAAGAQVAGWLGVVVAAVVGVQLVTRPASTVAVLAGATSAGMTLAGVLLLLGLRRAAGPAALRGLPRTALAAGGGAMAGAVAGRRLADGVLSGLGAGVGPAVLAAAAASVAAAVVTVATVGLLDRSTVRWMRDLRGAE